LKDSKAIPPAFKAALTAGIAALGLRLVITIGKNRGDAELASQPGDLLSSPAMAYQQAAAAPAQSGVELKQGFTNKLDASVGAPDQGIENFAIEEKRAMDAPSSPQGFAKRNVIDVTQIAPKPDQNGIEHGLPLCPLPPPIKIRP
jgi:hypothetical protein